MRSFQEEYRDFLRKHGVDFNERYVRAKGERQIDSRFQRLVFRKRFFTIFSWGRYPREK